MSKGDFGFLPSKRHHLIQNTDKDGKPIENSYRCVTCIKEQEKK